MSRSCLSCKWADVAMTDDGPVIECHLYPPMTVPDPLPPPADEPELEDEYHMLLEIVPNRYPQVRVADWCSKHQEREQS